MPDRLLRKALAFVTLGGAALLAFGIGWSQWRIRSWASRMEETARGLCRPGETFNITRHRRVGSPREVYDFFCVDAAGTQRSLTAELDAASPVGRPGTWAPLVIGAVAMTAGIVVGSRVLHRRAPRARRQRSQSE
jgi:hypothetical protein